MIPSTCQVGVTGFPFDVAEKANPVPAGTTTPDGLTATPPAGAATIETAAVPVAFEPVAVIVTTGLLGIIVGAVYTPVELSMVPPPVDTDHVKVAVGALARKALNCTCPLTGTLMLPGYIAIGPAAPGVGVGGTVAGLPPPQPAMKNKAATTTAAGRHSPT